MTPEPKSTDADAIAESAGILRNAIFDAADGRSMGGGHVIGVHQLKEKETRALDTLLAAAAPAGAGMTRDEIVDCLARRLVESLGGDWKQQTAKTRKCMRGQVTDLLKPIEDLGAVVKIKDEDSRK